MFGNIKHKMLVVITLPLNDLEGSKPMTIKTCNSTELDHINPTLITRNSTYRAKALLLQFFPAENIFEVTPNNWNTYRMNYSIAAPQQEA